MSDNCMIYIQHREDGGPLLKVSKSALENGFCGRYYVSIDRGVDSYRGKDRILVFSKTSDNGSDMPCDVSEYGNASFGIEMKVLGMGSKFIGRYMVVHKMSNGDWICDLDQDV